MEYNEKIEWLERYRASVRHQEMLEEEIETLRSAAVRVTACISGMPGRRGTDTNRLPRAVERLEETQKKLENQLESGLETRLEIMQGILSVPDQAGQEVLRRRYLMGQSVAEISAAMGVVERRVYQLHRAAVRDMQPPRQG